MPGEVCLLNIWMIPFACLWSSVLWERTLGARRFEIWQGLEPEASLQHTVAYGALHSVLVWLVLLCASELCFVSAAF